MVLATRVRISEFISCHMLAHARKLTKAIHFFSLLELSAWAPHMRAGHLLSICCILEILKAVSEENSTYVKASGKVVMWEL